MIPPLPIQQKFAALLKGTSELFATQEQQADRDRSSIQTLRDAAIDFVKDAGTPVFERFLAYLLGVTSIEAHYPLQSIRLLSLTARSAMIAGIPPAQMSELCTAAYFSDIGFRPSWLGQKGSHTELTAYHLRNMGFPWFSPSLMAMIENHHNSVKDTSPSKLLSSWARYLEVVYAMGSDNPPSIVLLPSLGLETLIEEKPEASTTIKLLLKTISAFPLGSWIQLSSGVPALVVGANPLNPLRPRVGVFKKGAGGRWVWHEHSLQDEPALQAMKEIHPSPAQATFTNRPHAWLPGWLGEPAYLGDELASVFQTALPDDSAPAEQHHSVEKIWAAPKATPAPAAGGHEPLPAPGASTEGNETELKKLRTDWETHVRSMEESVLKLRGGLVESYRRENDYFRQLLGTQAHMTPAAAAAPLASSDPMIAHSLPSTGAAVSDPPPSPVDPFEQELSPLEAQVAAQELELKSDEEAMRSLLRDIRQKLEKIKPVTSMSEKLGLWETEIRFIEEKLLPPVIASNPSFLTLKGKAAAARAYVESLRGIFQTPGNEAEIETRRQEWAGRYRAELLHNRAKNDEERTIQKSRVEKIKQLIGRHAEAVESAWGAISGSEQLP